MPSIIHNDIIPAGAEYNRATLPPLEKGDDFPFPPIEGDIYIFDDCLYEYTADGWALNQVIDKSRKTYTIQPIINRKSVTTICNSAFSECEPLEKVTLPEGLTTIGDSAFQYCYALSDINIPDSVTSIGTSAFKHCYSISNITVPEGVKKINDDTFYGCESLSSITLPEGLTSIGKWAFFECTFIDSIIISCDTVVGHKAFPDNVIVTRLPPKSVADIVLSDEEKTSVPTITEGPDRDER